MKRPIYWALIGFLATGLIVFFVHGPRAEGLVPSKINPDEIWSWEALDTDCGESVYCYVVAQNSEAEAEIRWVIILVDTLIPRIIKYAYYDGSDLKCYQLSGEAGHFMDYAEITPGPAETEFIKAKLGRWIRTN